MQQLLRGPASSNKSQPGCEAHNLSKDNNSKLLYASRRHEAHSQQHLHHQLAHAAAALAASCTLMLSGPAFATDPVAVGTCVLGKCQTQLARCIGDAKCLTNLVCINACNNRPDEIACQLRCGDLYADEAVDAFNACAISTQKCVPQIADVGLFPTPSDCALDTKFDLNMLDGRWFISAGYNKLFDTFDCQEHFFAVPEPGKLYAKITWRITKPDNDWIYRETIQRFNQVEAKPAVLLNRGNEYLNYQDDWFIIASRPDEYFFCYYKGSNDACT